MWDPVFVQRSPWRGGLLSLRNHDLRCEFEILTPQLPASSGVGKRSPSVRLCQVTRARASMPGGWTGAGYPKHTNISGLGQIQHLRCDGAYLKDVTTLAPIPSELRYHAAR